MLKNVLLSALWAPPHVFIGLVLQLFANRDSEHNPNPFRSNSLAAEAARLIRRVRSRSSDSEPAVVLQFSADRARRTLRPKRVDPSGKRIGPRLTA